MFQKILNKIKKKPTVKIEKGSTRGSLPVVPVEKKVMGGNIKEGVIKADERKINGNGEKRVFEQGLVSTKDIIAPSALQVDFDYVRIGKRYYRTLFVSGYPRFVGLNWLSPLVNFDASLNVSMYVYPTDGKEILDDLRRKIAEMQAEISTDIQRGRVVNPATQAKLEDALSLQTDLVKGEERFFQFGLYVTISAESIDRLNQINKNLEAALGSLMIISKRTTLQMEEGFNTTLPTCNDEIDVTRNMDTTSLATTFPFVSSDLSDDKGIMYGINEHNGSLVIFDRFSMPNYNSVVFATSGVGKSYLIKLEAMRSLMMGTEIIVVDPENEYKSMCEAIGGQYIAFGYGEASKINPFDLSLAEEEGENVLNTKILSLHRLLKVMLGKMDPIEESILDKALMAAYKAKGITPDPETQKKEAPLIEDLYKSLIGMEETKAQSLAARLEKFIKGSFAGIFNQKTTVDLKNKFVVFGIRNLEETLRPVAMHIVLDYIWTVVKKELKKRILVVDEAWYLMQYDDSAAFLRGIIKRGRKYFLGTTTITQDVEDFLGTPYGKEIVTNSAIQILLKQHSAAIDKVAEIFYLSEGEKQLLLSADKGEGIFFAGQNHVALRVIASESEHQLITSDPGELIKQQKRIEEKLEEAEVKTKVKPGMDVQMKNENRTVSMKVGKARGTSPVVARQDKKEEVVVKPLPEVKKKIEERPEEIVKEVGAGADLKKKIERMEQDEAKKIAEFKKDQAGGIKDNKGGLKKGVLYKDLGRGNVPRFTPPKAEAVSTVDSGRPLGVLNNKPIFVNKQKEVKVAQPKQFLKKPVADFGKVGGIGRTGTPVGKMPGKTGAVGKGGQTARIKPAVVKPVAVKPAVTITTKTGQKAGDKMSYDELLGS